MYIYILCLWSIFQLCAAENYTWSNAVIGGGGFIPGIVFSPTQSGLVYARTDIGGIYRQTTPGEAWVPLTDVFNNTNANFLGAESLATDPLEPNRLYYAAGLYTDSWSTSNGAIFASEDYGSTWKTMWPAPFKMGGNDDGRSAGERLAVHPSKNNIVYYGSQANGPWSSNDFGASFSQVSSFPVPPNDNDGRGVVFVLFYDDNGDIIYVGVDDAESPIWVSLDGGMNWKPAVGAPTGLFPHHGAFSADRSTFYTTFSNGPGPNGVTFGAVYSFDVSSGTWTDISPFIPGKNGQPQFGYAGLSTDMTSSSTLVVSTLDLWWPSDDIYRSTDGGKSWISIHATAQLNISSYPYLSFGSTAPRFGWWIGVVRIDPFDSNRVMYGTGATLYGTLNMKDADLNQTTIWEPMVAGIEECAVLDLACPPTGPALFSCVGDDGGFTHYDVDASPSGGMWTNPTFSNADSVDFAESFPNIVARVGLGSSTPVHNGAISYDYGATWTPFYSEPTNSEGGGMVAISADGTTVLWAPSQTGVVSWSINNGSSWTSCEGLQPGFQIKSDRKTASIFYAYQPATAILMRSSDFGRTFSAVNSSGRYIGGSLQVSFAAEGDLWIPSTTGGLLHSIDGGQTFSSVPAVMSADTIGFGRGIADLDGPPALYIAGVVGADQPYGVWRSWDGGATWTLINDAHHQWGSLGQRITGDRQVLGRVYIATNGRGIVMGEMADSRRF